MKHEWRKNEKVIYIPKDKPERIKPHLLSFL